MLPLLYGLKLNKSQHLKEQIVSYACKVCEAGVTDIRATELAAARVVVEFNREWGWLIEHSEYDEELYDFINEYIGTMTIDERVYYYSNTKSLKEDVSWWKRNIVEYTAVGYDRLDKKVEYYVAKGDLWSKKGDNEVKIGKIIDIIGNLKEYNNIAFTTGITQLRRMATV